MKIKRLSLIVIIILLGGFINSSKCQSGLNTEKFVLSFDGGAYLSVNYKFFGGVVGLNLQSKKQKFGLNVRLKYQNIYQTNPINLFADSWYIGFAEFNYRFDKKEKFPFKLSLGLGPISEDIDLFYTVNPYLDLGYIITSAIQIEVNNFEFECRMDTHTYNLFHLNYPYTNNPRTTGFNVNITLGAIYRINVIKFY